MPTDQTPPARPGNAATARIKQRFIASYIVALALIAIVAVGAHGLVLIELNDEVEAAEIVNLSGRQRMLSQRAHALALKMNDAPDDALTAARLVETGEALADSQQRLIDYARTNPMNGALRGQLAELFLAPGTGLETQLSEFLTYTDLAAAGTLSPAGLERMGEMAYGTMFARLDRAVALFEEDARQGVANIARIHMIQVTLTLLVLLGEAVFIFQPLLRHFLEAVVTERRSRDSLKDALGKLHENYTRMDFALRGAATGIWELESATGELYCSQRMNRILGLPDGAYLTQDELAERVHPEDAQNFEGFSRRLAFHRGGHSDIIRLRHENGNYVSLEIRGNIVQDDDGSIRRMAGSFTDITSEQRADRLRQDIWSVLIRQDISFDLKFQSVLEMMSVYFDLDLALISRIEDDVYEVIHAVAPEGGPEPGATFRFSETYCSHVYAANAPKAFHHAGLSEISSHPCYRNFGLESYIGAPLFVGGERYGTINFSSPSTRTRPFSRYDIQLIDNVAQWVGYELDRARAIQALSESEERFALAAKGASVGIWDWKDITSDEEIWSDMFYALIGYEREELPSTLDSFKSILHPDDMETTFAAVESHFRNQTPFQTEYRLRHKDGTYRWFLGSGQAVWDDGGEPRRMIGSIMDIHELKEAQRELKERTLWLERTNEDLDHFAYIASHDLRAPLRGMDQVTGWIEEDLGEQLDEDSREKFTLLRGRIARMDQLLSDILAYSRAGKRDSAPEDVDCNAVLDDIVGWIDLPPGFSVTPEAPLPVLHMSRTLMEQLVLNLVSNAVKHHDRPNGTVILSHIEHDDCHEFVVTDDGPGIAPQYQDRIFKMFQTLKRRDEVEGSGIGLAIVNKMVETQGGEVWIHSPVTGSGTDGRGAAFHFTLPKRMEEEHDNAPPFYATVG